MTELLENLWVQRVGFVVGGLVLGIVLELVVIRRAHKLAERSRFKWDDLLIGSVRGVATIWSGAGGVYFALNVGIVNPLLMNTMRSVLMVLVLGVVVIAGMRAVGGAVEMLSGRASGAVRSWTLFVNLARLGVAILGLFIILQNLGIDITALITALGIGGIAVALALQDTLGNLFAGIQIILSKQVRQLDYIRLSSGEEGWVTDVKGRSTTIQTVPDGNLVTVPNAVINAVMSIPRFWRMMKSPRMATAARARLTNNVHDLIAPPVLIESISTAPPTARIAAITTAPSTMIMSPLWIVFTRSGSGVPTLSAR